MCHSRFWRSRRRYEAASDRCSGRMSAEPERSAMVRASLMMREHALADRPMRSIRRSSSALQSGDNGQYFSV